MHRPFRECIVIHSLHKNNCAFDHWNAIKMTFLACRQLKFFLRQVLEDTLLEFDEHPVLIVLKKRNLKSSILSLAKLN